ncbi:hypothetical protein L1987_64718 [Smallanthus sonchifolius]|uniref:Uncharacterized protein n=1 Tax=Smallanthus sonchifolius TaxID=185202 RepID=A0ACB9BSJ0_9ASTR|nr:hypothetical protein L1987_64718 [Smallanthus sonchifolius]
MASTSSSIPTTRYDVFLSFRGEDTRHTFTDHLYQALIEAGLSTFRDNDEIDRGEELKPEIETAITRSRASIVVLSKNYANSRWCLDELCLILDHKECNHFVLPIFYQVDPSNVRNQRGSYAIKRSLRAALTKGSIFTGFSNFLGTEAKEWSKCTKVNVRRWKEALTKVGNLSGMELSGWVSVDGDGRFKAMVLSIQTEKGFQDVS